MTGIDFGEVVMAIAGQAPADAIVITDAGNFSSWVHRHWRLSPDNTMLGAIGGAMGFGVPAAVAAGLAAPERMAIVVVGDGGMLMTGQEIATAVATGAAPKIFVSNNHSYATIRTHQEKQFPNRLSGTKLTNPDFTAWARSFGVHAVTIRMGDDVAAKVAEALAHPGAFVVEPRRGARSKPRSHLGVYDDHQAARRVVALHGRQHEDDKQGGDAGDDHPPDVVARHVARHVLLLRGGLTRLLAPRRGRGGGGFRHGRGRRRGLGEFRRRLGLLALAGGLLRSGFLGGRLLCSRLLGGRLLRRRLLRGRCLDGPLAGSLSTASGSAGASAGSGADGNSGFGAGWGSPLVTTSAKRAKKSSAMRRAVESISRLPIWASLPPTLASTS
jgi:hypothetical protein